VLAAIVILFARTSVSITAQQPRACLLDGNFALIGNEQLFAGTEHMARSFLSAMVKMSR
jgi:hypothetical protein